MCVCVCVCVHVEKTFEKNNKKSKMSIKHNFKVLTKIQSMIPFSLS